MCFPLRKAAQPSGSWHLHAYAREIKGIVVIVVIIVILVILAAIIIIVIMIIMEKYAPVDIEFWPSALDSVDQESLGGVDNAFRRID